MQLSPKTGHIASELILELSLPESSNEPSAAVLQPVKFETPIIADSSTESDIFEPAILNPDSLASVHNKCEDHNHLEAM